MVRRNYDIPGLEGQVQLKHRVEHDLLGASHTLQYRNRLGKNLTVKLESVLQRKVQRYLTTRKTQRSDTIVNDGRTWIHVGETSGNGKRFISTCAEIVADGEDVGGEVTLNYVICATSPFDRPYRGSFTAPLK